MSSIEIRVPDIGDFKNVPVIDILVKPGDVVNVDDPLLTLESDKASMDVPSPAAGTVERIAVKKGDKVSEGSVIVTLTSAAAETAAAASPPAAAGAAPGPAPSSAKADMHAEILVLGAG